MTEEPPKKIKVEVVVDEKTTDKVQIEDITEEPQNNQGSSMTFFITVKMIKLQFLNTH